VPRKLEDDAELSSTFLLSQLSRVADNFAIAVDKANFMGAIALALNTHFSL